MDLENQRLSSPYYPQHYFDDEIGCEWLITAPERHIIFLEFDHFNVSKYLYKFKTEIYIKYNDIYSSWIFIQVTFLLCLMEYVIKQTNYKY